MIEKLVVPIQKHGCRIEVDIVFDNGQYILSNGDLGLLAVGDTIDDAIVRVNEQFDVVWDSYVNESLSNLTASAIALRNRLIDLVGSEDT